MNIKSIANTKGIVRDMAASTVVNRLNSNYINNGCSNGQCSLPTINQNTIKANTTVADVDSNKAVMNIPDSPSFDRRYTDAPSIVGQLATHLDYVLSLVMTNPQRLIDELWNNEKSPLSIDSHCRDNLRKMARLTAAESRALRKGRRARWNPNQRCPACTFMYKLVDLDHISLDDAVELYGFDGTYNIIKYDTLVPSLLINTNVNQRMFNLLNNHSEITSCEPRLIDLTNAVFIQADPMTNYLLVSLVANHILNTVGIESSTDIITSFVCNTDGYVFTRNYQTFNDVLLQVARSQLTMESVITSIIKQMSATLDVLQYYDLCIVDFGLSKLRFELEPCSYIYDGQSIEGNVTFKLANMESASITWYQQEQTGQSSSDNQPVRIFNGNTISEIIVDDSDWKPQIESIPFTFYDDIDNGSLEATEVSVYRIGGDGTLDDIRSKLLRGMGYPMYQSSFNSYVMLLSLMSEPEVRKVVLSSLQLERVFRSMFVPSQYGQVVEMVNRLTSDSTADDIMTEIADIYLRCDATTHLWQMVKTLL